MKQIIIFSLFLFGSFATQAQSTEEIITELKSYGNTINTTNFDGSKSRQMQLLDQLRVTSSDGELLNLLQNSNHALVKVFSFWSLNSPSKSVIQDIINKEKEEMQEITIIRGCFTENTSVFSIIQNNISLNPKQKPLSSVIIVQ